MHAHAELSFNTKKKITEYCTPLFIQIYVGYAGSYNMGNILFTNKQNPSVVTFRHVKQHLLMCYHFRIS